jgi:hypothetical protein
VASKPNLDNGFDRHFWVSNKTVSEDSQYQSEVDNILSVVQHLVVDIGGPTNALLPALAFEGATRRNKPLLNVSFRFRAFLVLTRKKSCLLGADFQECSPVGTYLLKA